MPKNILEIQNLTITFPRDGTPFTAVDGISFDIARGQSVGIIGESGSGKSVTALSVMRLLPQPPARVTAGRMIYRDAEGSETDLLNAGNRDLREIRGNRIAMIFQEPMTSLNPVTRCGNQVVEAIRSHRKITLKEAREKTIDLFREVRLPRPEEMFYAHPHEISGGQKQRVMIAMAIASGPDLLIADEPTTALDVTVQKSIISLLKELQQKYGMAILFITHDLGLAGEIADQILVMNQGRVVESGNARDIFRNPVHPYTRGLLACRPAFDRNLRRLPTVKDFMMNEGNIRPAELISSLSRNEKDYRHKTQQIYQNTPLMKAIDLRTWFRSRGKSASKAILIKAVDDVSLDIYPGEVLGLVGESGCGKTTFGKTILRLNKATSGEIYFGESKLNSLEGNDLRRIRKDMQIIFQDPYGSLNPRITAGSAIMEPMKVHGIGKNQRERKELAMELLVKVGLEKGHFNRYPHEFSGGQRQRICIARALAVRPKFIVCDESVSSLDVSVQAQVLNLLADLREELGLTYIFITHDLSVVKFISDRVAVMHDGKIVELGDTGTVFDHPASEYTKELFEAIPGQQLDKSFKPQASKE